MKVQGIEFVLGAGASVVVLNEVSLTWIGMLYLPVPNGTRKRIPPWLAVPTLWSAGIFLAPLIGRVAGFTEPVVLSGIGFIVAAAPVFFVRLVMRRIGGNDAV
jgi:hypothetical protein